MRLVVASVGADTAWVASMIREERLHATIERISERDYRRDFGSTSTPRIYVMERGLSVSSHKLDAENLLEKDSVERVLDRVAGP